MFTSYDNDPAKIQLVLTYCASRLRAAAIATAKEHDQATQTRMQSSLLYELVCTFVCPYFAFLRVVTALRPGLHRHGRGHRPVLRHSYCTKNPCL
jgi:hypothetical protein